MRLLKLPPPPAEPEKLSTRCFGMQKHEFELFRPFFLWLCEESKYFLTFWKPRKVMLSFSGLMIANPFIQLTAHWTRLNPLRKEVWLHANWPSCDCDRIQIVEYCDYIVNCKTHNWYMTNTCICVGVYMIVYVYISSCCFQPFNKQSVAHSISLGTALMLPSTCLKSFKFSLPAWWLGVTDVISDK